MVARSQCAKASCRGPVGMACWTKSNGHTGVLEPWPLPTCFMSRAQYRAVGETSQTPAVHETASCILFAYLVYSACMCCFLPDRDEGVQCRQCFEIECQQVGGWYQAGPFPTEKLFATP